MVKLKRKTADKRADEFGIDVGKRIRLRRIEQQISPAELGRRLNVSFQQIREYENGSTRVSMDRLVRIARVLDVPLSFFLDKNGLRRKTEGLLFLDAAWNIRLVRAYARIKNEKIKQQILLLIESVGDKVRE